MLAVEVGLRGAPGALGQVTEVPRARVVYLALVPEREDAFLVGGLPSY